ncbi:glycosyltransferase, partial [bacterium M00.F.Ca.ET.168.01.1.1]
FLSGINLFMTGIIGLYVGGIHAEVKRRPLYVVDRLTGFEEAVAAMRNAEASKDVPAARERRLG